MDLQFNIKTTAFFGDNIVNEKREVFKKLGKKAFLVTGKTSAVKSGALEDIVKILDDQGIEYSRFDDIVNNPTLKNVDAAGKAARDFGADYIIGIGGGSPLDASKAVAVLAVNEIEPLKLYEGNYENDPLPIIAIPTTAGTGSEITPYSILTRPDLETKKSFSDEKLFPAYALLDPKYTYSLSYEFTIGTAFDAFTHAIEGYLSSRATDVSDIFSERAIQLFGEVFDSLISGDISKGDREKLLYLSMLAGIVISHTGTTILHSMGYCLTYFKDIPHGTANAMLTAGYLNASLTGAEKKVERIFSLLGITDIGAFASKMDSFKFNYPEITNKELDKFTENAYTPKSVNNTSFKVTKDIIERIFRISLGKDK